MMAKMRMIMFYLPEGGTFGRDNFKPLVLRYIIRKQDGWGRFEILAYLLHN